ncbi:DUF4307 domain-containing protein [Microlunatus speluncae]|uniref:DUF4307 domain-containing protein n=1 Tax=Microlunatus speluncae TaxID=2594267 RepID=UPI0012664D2F|nr:DUF4307 domain-containing protein [Microlunatus speluncae]
MPDPVPQLDDAEAAERIRNRYPRSRIPRPLVIALVGIVALAGLGWLIWVATINSQPAVSGQLAGFRVVSDAATEVTLTVDRPDPSVAAQCLVIAQAIDYERVGEIEVVVPPSQHQLVDLPVTIKTLRRAISASVDSCRKI